MRAAMRAADRISRTSDIFPSAAICSPIFCITFERVTFMSER